MVPISVVMSVYNEPVDWIRQSIDSILNQTFRDFEFIIINDNPEGISQKKLLKDFAAKDNRIKIIENEENKGLTKSLNIGISEAKGKYVARMDADDISMPNRFQIQYDYMESHPEIDVCGTWAKLFGDIGKFSEKHLKTPETFDIIKIQALFYAPMIHPSVMIRMERLPIKPYNEEFIKAQDYVLWGELLMKGYILHNLPDYLIKYRLTIKSKKDVYTSQQLQSADTIRRDLLRRLFIDCNEQDIILHNRICNEQRCDLVDAEKWLITLKRILIEEYLGMEGVISSVIRRLWLNINLTNANSFRSYIKSPLTEVITLKDWLRFARHRLF